MIIVMHVAMLKHENMMAQRMLRLYVRHADFQVRVRVFGDWLLLISFSKLRLRNHIAAALLAVDVRAYVKGVLTQMMVSNSSHYQRSVRKCSLVTLNIYRIILEIILMLSAYPQSQKMIPSTGKCSEPVSVMSWLCKGLGWRARWAWIISIIAVLFVTQPCTDRCFLQCSRTAGHLYVNIKFAHIRHQAAELTFWSFCIPGML